ncbi:hypothetical protein DPEC_G00109920 [Dallia pectoralis]|uniref:Uncharacterized protein n=1 Tax=Dallia pectoralis TaxID=75939 RepID=A0ACC2GTD5_DALPE|nr:hypothetical protein DPEC_G00109920 [Dallia pectoralis]
MDIPTHTQGAFVDFLNRRGVMNGTQLATDSGAIWSIEERGMEGKIGGVKDSGKGDQERGRGMLWMSQSMEPAGASRRKAKSKKERELEQGPDSGLGSWVLRAAWGKE